MCSQNTDTWKHEPSTSCHQSLNRADMNSASVSLTSLGPNSILILSFLFRYVQCQHYVWRVEGGHVLPHSALLPFWAGYCSSFIHDFIWEKGLHRCNQVHVSHNKLLLCLMPSQTQGNTNQENQERGHAKESRSGGDPRIKVR